MVIFAAANSWRASSIRGWGGADIGFLPFPVSVVRAN
jgi:hypothetical protein